MKENRPNISVIVCTFNRPEHLRDCADAILASDYPHFELLVMDQSTDEKTRQVVETLGDPRARYFHLDAPGKCRAMNAGVRESVGDRICFTDDDCIVTPAWISRFVTEFDADRELSAVYGQTLPRFVGPKRVEFATYKSTRRRLYRGRRSPYRVGGAGGNMAYRRNALATVGPFDENLGPGARFKAVEDNEYFYRTFCLGLKAAYVPTVVLYHKQLLNESTFAERHRDYRFGDGAFIAKYLLTGDWHPLYYYLSLELSRVFSAVTKLQLRYAKFVTKCVWLTTKGIYAYATWHRTHQKRRTT